MPQPVGFWHSEALVAEQAPRDAQHWALQNMPIDTRIAVLPGCPLGQRNALQGECFEAVTSATRRAGLDSFRLRLNLVNDSSLPSGCAYSQASKDALYNSHPAGSTQWGYQLACTSDANPKRRPPCNESLSGCSVLACITAPAIHDEVRNPMLATAVRAVLSWDLARVRASLQTENAELMKAILAEQGLPIGNNGTHEVHVAQAQDQRLTQMRRSAHFLGFAHRDVMLQAVRTAQFDLFVYLEDDIELTWPQLLAWDRDDRALRAAGSAARRGFYRYEVTLEAASGGGGTSHESHSLAGANGAGGGVVAAGSHVLPDFKACDFNFSRWKCRMELPGSKRKFVGLANPYSATWVATRQQLLDLVASPHWTPNDPEAAPELTGRQHASAMGALHGCPWPARECAAAADGFLRRDALHGERESTSDCFSAFMVPYDDHAEGPLLDEAAGVHHLGQNYWDKWPMLRQTRDGCLRPGGWPLPDRSRFDRKKYLSGTAGVAEWGATIWNLWGLELWA